MIDECFPLAITFPRFVKLENTRLTVLYWILALIVLFFTTYTFVVSEGYYTEKAPDGNVQFWPQNWNIPVDKAKELNLADEQREYCRTPEKYEFCDDPECSWSARAMQCIDLCTNDSVGDCVEPSERWFKADSGLFFPTFYTETTTRRFGEDRMTKRDVSTKKWIIKGVEDMGVDFQHEYDVLTPDHKREQGSSTFAVSNGLVTILKDLDGNDIDRWGPGERVKLSLKQIMQAGHISLDAVQEVGHNFLESARIPEGILARLAGIDITLELSYHNPSSYAHPGEGHLGPVCFITVHHKYWSSQTQMQVVDYLGSSRFRYYQGVRIQFRSTGSFSWLHMDNIFNKLSQLLVFFGATKQIVFLFAITALGVVSKVYKGFVYQKIALGKETCGMAARLTSHTSTFVELKDNAHGISEERLLRRFKRIFEHNKEIDDSEIRRLVNFVYSRMAKHDKDGIDVQDFSQACTHGEALHFKTLVELFDADRKKGFLERTFAGPTIRKLFKSDQNIFKSHREAKASEAIDLSKSTTHVFEPGYVAAPVKTMPAPSDMTDSTKDTSDSIVHLEQVKFRRQEAPTCPRSERVLFCDAGELFCSSQACSGSPGFETIVFSPACSPAFTTRDLSDPELFASSQAIVAPCLAPCSLANKKTGSPDDDSSDNV